MGYWDRMKDISELKGKTIVELNGMEEGCDHITFVCQDGTIYDMYHQQDCCEYVRLYDVVGDPKDIVGEVIEEAYSSTSDSMTSSESGTWTYYNIRTRIGGVHLRWLGESNGYYSEGVSFIEREQSE